MNNRRYVVCDRDGTLIKSHHYLSNPDLVALLPNTAAALRKFRDLGLGIVVLTNQSPIGRGLFTRDCLEQIHERLTALIKHEGVKLDAIYYCPHTPEDNCGCRKPKTGLLRDAAQQFNFDPRECFVIGDNVCDIEMGARCGAHTFLVRTGHGAEIAENAAESTLKNAGYVVDDVLEAADVIGALLHGKSGEKKRGLSKNGAKHYDYQQDTV